MTRPRLNILHVILAAIAAVGIAACNTTGCIDNQSSIPLAGFYNEEGAAVAVTSVEVGGVDAPADSLLYGSSASLAQVYLPFRSTATTTAFYLRNVAAGEENAVADTITFHYTSSPYFASEECGAMYCYHIDRCTFTTHFIDNVEITDSLVTNTDVERIKIFVKTVQPDADDESTLQE